MVNVIKLYPIKYKKHHIMAIFKYSFFVYLNITIIFLSYKLVPFFFVLVVVVSFFGWAYFIGILAEKRTCQKKYTTNEDRIYKCGYGSHCRHRTSNI